MKFIDIGTLSKQSGIAVSALHYYEKMGLIKPIGRHGLRRQYDEHTLLQLNLIAMGKAAGFSLHEIREMFDKDRNPDIHRPSLNERADELDRQIRRLKTLSSLLRHVAQCPASSHLDCERFQKLLRMASPTAAHATSPQHAATAKK